MVAAKSKTKADSPVEAPSAPKRFGTTVRLSEVVASGTRLEASCYALEARSAIETMQAAGLPLVPVYGPGGLCHEAYNAFRFKRIFVEQEYGFPFFTSADIISIRQRPEKFLSKKQTKKLKNLVVKKHDVLVSCSGTIGNVALVGESYNGVAFSQDALRLTSAEANTSGYVSAFLRSYFGRAQVLGVVYGAVIQHIEPEHMTRILIPDLHPIRRASIGSKMLEAVSKRDEANILLDEAEGLLLHHLGLPSLKDIEKSLPKRTSTEVRARELNDRLDAAFHSPICNKIIDNLSKISIRVACLGDSEVTKEIRPITTFRKRTYVARGGITILNSKQIGQVDPIDIKRLARGAHERHMKEIGLSENMITITRSGTVGNVNMIPKYMVGWAGSEDATRIFAAKNMNPGYLYAWLASPHGNLLIKRYSYGAVVVHIDREMISAVPVPLLEPEQMDEVGNMVLKANRLRNEAWELERTAIKELETILEGKSPAAKS